MRPIPGRPIRPVGLTLLCLSSSLALMLVSQFSVFDGPGGLALIIPWLVVLAIHVFIGPVALYATRKQGPSLFKPFIYLYFLIFAGAHVWLFIHGSGLDREAQTVWQRHSNPLEAELHATLQGFEMLKASKKVPDPGQVAVAIQFVRRGADSNFRGLHSKPFLLRACALGQDELALAMLQHGAEASVSDSSGVTPLHAAAEMCSPEVINELLRRQAAIDARDAWKNTPLILAVRAGRLDNVTALLKHGPLVDSVDQNGQTPLLEAVARNDAPMIRAILLAGADVNTRDLRGRSALAVAATGSNPNTARILLEHGAVLNTPGQGGYLPLREALRKGRMDEADALLKIGADVNATNAEGDSLLAEVATFSVHYSSSGSTGKHGIMEWLLRNGADPDGRDRNGRTAHELALRMGDDESVRLLLQAGAKH